MILHYGRAHDWIDKLLAERLKPKSSLETMTTAAAGSGILRRNESGKRSDHSSVEVIPLGRINNEKRPTSFSR